VAKTAANRFSNIRMDATLDGLKNYFSRTIRPVYDACNLDSGSCLRLSQRPEEPFADLS